MLTEFQPYIIDFCKNCGAILYDCRDWDKPHWEDDFSWNKIECEHKAANHKEECND